ncbi:hypothetical protein C8A01DRAFT_40402 [Parachaetomium inaequale]|uniref:SRR1-like domain-containing protein n=1 Tax=Parachaetomium inaequale TaxID=2588326 RepID=A0AAN6SMU7_9PEZI|nr:hypothetical protein C8A01DRAFT_40402 [Parachaetomium inaequale]
MDRDATRPVETTARQIRHHVYSGKCRDDLLEPTDTKGAQEKEKAVKRLQELYDEGVPFFKKEVFGHILDQLTFCRANPRPPGSSAEPHMILIIAVDGTKVEIELETGRALQHNPAFPGMELVVGDPYLYYRTVQHLTETGDLPRHSRRLAYCPTRLMYPLSVRDAPTEPVAALEDIQNAFLAGVRAWEDSEDCQRLRSFFEKASLPKITKIVAFACSSMEINFGNKDQRASSRNSRSIHQHALILTLRDIILGRGGNAEKAADLQCFAQDPVYCDVDEQVLKAAGITVLRDPRGFLEVDDESVVLSFSPDIPVRQIVADIARPAVLVWNHVKSEAETAEDYAALDQKNAGTDPESSRLRDMVRDCYLEPVALDSKGKFGPFGRASVYIRRG